MLCALLLCTFLYYLIVIGIFSSFGFFYRFRLPWKNTFEDSSDVENYRKQLGLTGKKIFERFSTLCKQIFAKYPRARIIYLGCAKTWTTGPRQGVGVKKERRLTFQVRGGTFRQRWSVCKQTESRKKESFSRREEVLALSCYKNLRAHFLKILKRTSVLSFPNVSEKTGLKNVYFNDVFGGLRNCDIWDVYGHLSYCGALRVSYLFEMVLACCLKV